MAKRSPPRTQRSAKTQLALVPPDRIDRLILLIRAQRVMLDADLAALYGVPTKALNQAVKRNANRFPEDFCFQLTPLERDQVVTNCDHLARLKFSPVCPYAFTEHGAIMAASLLSSPQAVALSVLVVRAFVRLRYILATHKDLARRIAALERRFTDKSDEHEAHIRQIYALIEELMNPPAPPKGGRIGFRPATGA